MEESPGAMQGLFVLLEGLTGGGSFRARTDKKGKKGQKEMGSSFCPFLPFLSVLVFQVPPKPARRTEHE
jgi:hypothetical protein